jgi:hypothetical protein
VALTADQLALLRAEIGPAEPPDDSDLDEIYALRGGLVGVARHVWSERLAVLIATPAAFTAVGDYSQNTAANIATIRQRLIELAGFPDTSDELPPGGATIMFAVVPMVRVGQDR